MPGLDRLRRPQALVEGAGFGGYAGGTRSIVDEVSDAQDLLDWSRSGSFGNSLAEFEGTERQRLVNALAARLEPYRREGVIRLERYPIFATAIKPAAH